MRLVEHGLPFVTIGRTGSEEAHGWVDLDYAGLVTAAVERLRALGHRRVALVNRPQALLDREYGPAFRALDAFEKTVAEHDLLGRALCCEDDEQAGADCVAELFATDGTPSGIVAVNERSLAGVVRALHARGSRIPDDVSVLAVTSENNARSLTPEITAADVPTAEMGRHAVESLLRLVADPAAEPAHILLAPPFVDRRSHAPAPGSAAGG